MGLTKGLNEVEGEQNARQKTVTHDEQGGGRIGPGSGSAESAKGEAVVVVESGCWKKRVVESEQTVGWAGWGRWGTVQIGGLGTEDRGAGAV